MRILLTKPSISRPGSTVGSPRIPPTGLSSTLCCLTFSGPSGKNMSLIIESPKLTMTPFWDTDPITCRSPCIPVPVVLVPLFFFSPPVLSTIPWFSFFTSLYWNDSDWLEQNTHSIQHICIKWSFSFPTHQHPAIDSPLHYLLTFDLISERSSARSGNFLSSVSIMYF